MFEVFDRFGLPAMDTLSVPQWRRWIEQATQAEIPNG
jgi:hypothetical protein